MLYLERLCEINPGTGASMVLEADSGGARVLIRFGLLAERARTECIHSSLPAMAPHPVNYESTHRYSGDDFEKVQELLKGYKVERMSIVWAWSSQLLGIAPPVVALGAALPRLGGMYISVDAIRVALGHIPMLTMWHDTESLLSHALLLWFLMEGLPQFKTMLWSPISDRAKGLLEAFCNIVLAVNPLTQHLYDKPRLWRNVIGNFPLLRFLDEWQGPGGASKQLSIVIRSRAKRALRHNIPEVQGGAQEA